MIVLHAGLCGHRLLLWGESSHASTDAAGESHPRSVGSGSLRELLSDSGVEASPGEEEVLAWLPTTADSDPLVSDPVLGDETPGEELALKGWQVPVLGLTPGDTVDLLADWRGRRVLRPGVIIGHDLAHWAEALPLAASLAAEGLYLPGILETNGRYRSCWEPVFSGEYAEWRAELAASMPGACRALTPLDAGAPPEAAPVSAVTTFARLVLDALARSQDTGDPPAVLHDRWLTSLTGSEASLEGTDEELAGLAAEVRAWHRRLTLPSSGPFSLLLRLDEPPDPEDEPWTVRFLLRAADDPSPAGACR